MFLQDLILKMEAHDNVSNSAGLLYGDTGMAITHFLLHRATRNNAFEIKANQLLEAVFEKAATLNDPTFEGGLSGIGWAVEWLSCEKFLTNIDAHSALEELDTVLCQRIAAWGTGNKCSLPTAVGYGFYLLKRMAAQTDLNDSFLLLVQHIQHSLYKIDTVTRLDFKEQHINDMCMLLQLLLQMQDRNAYFSSSILNRIDELVQQLLSDEEHTHNMAYLAIFYFAYSNKNQEQDAELLWEKFLKRLEPLTGFNNLTDANCFSLLRIALLVAIHFPALNKRLYLEDLIESLLRRELSGRLYNGVGALIIAGLFLSHPTLVSNWNELLFIEPLSTQVPKHIHLITGPKANAAIKRCMNSWQQLESHGYEIKIWTDDSIALFLQRNYPFACDAFIHARNHAEAADIARYLIIHAHGGYYMDWDVELLCVEGFLKICHDHVKGYLVIDPANNTLASEVFAASRHEPYLLSLVKDIVMLYEQQLRDAMFTPQYSGPYRMRDSLEKHANSSQALIPVKEIFAYDYSEIRTMPERPITQPLIHYWVHSWM